MTIDRVATDKLLTTTRSVRKRLDLTREVEPQVIQDCIAATRIQMTDEEAILLFPKVKAFVQEKGRQPNINALDPLEQRMAQALIFIQKLRKQRGK